MTNLTETNSRQTLRHGTVQPVFASCQRQNGCVWQITRRQQHWQVTSLQLYELHVAAAGNAVSLPASL